MNKYKIYKEVIDICICLYSCYELYNREIINIPYVMFFYSIFDLPFNTTSLKIHHSVTAICALIYIFTEPTQDKHDFLLQFMKCEYSTLFLCLKNLLEYAQNRNLLITIAIKSMELVFVVSFFYFRIFNIFDILVNSHEYLNNNALFYLGTYTLYILNLYWFTKILRKITKILQYYVSINTEQIMYAQQYIYFLVPFYNGIIIASNVSLLYLLDAVATSIYCLFGYVYNNGYYNSLVNKTRMNPHLYLYEKISIHIRSCIGLLSVCLYKCSTIDFILIIISFSSHIYMTKEFYIDYYKEFYEKPGVLKHEKNVYKLPILFDNICLYFFCEPYDKTMVNTILFLFIFITYIQPFGKNEYHYVLYPFIMNYIVIHGLLPHGG
jgi:hypothetical protein